MTTQVNKDHRNFAIIDVENCRSQLRFLPNFVKTFEKTFIAYSDYYIRSAIDFEMNNIGKKITDKKVEINFINSENLNFDNKKNVADVELMFWTFKLVYDLYHKKKFDKPVDIYLISEDNAFEIFTEILKIKYPKLNFKLIRGNEEFLISPKVLKEYNFYVNDYNTYCFLNKSEIKFNPLAELCSQEFIITTKRVSDGKEYTRKYKNLEKVFIKTLVKHKIIPMYVDRLCLDDTIIMNENEHRIIRIESKKIEKK